MNGAGWSLLGVDEERDDRNKLTGQLLIRVARPAGSVVEIPVTPQQLCGLIMESTRCLRSKL